MIQYLDLRVRSHVRPEPLAQSDPILEYHVIVIDLRLQHFGYLNKEGYEKRLRPFVVIIRPSQKVAHPQIFTRPCCYKGSRIRDEYDKRPILLTVFTMAVR